MLIQRGVLCCPRCEKDGIPPEKQWLAPEWLVCLGCGDKLVKQTDAHNLPDTIVRLALLLCRTRMFHTEGMGSKTSFPGRGSIMREDPRLCLKSRIVSGLSAAITWQDILLDTNEKPGVSWDAFCRRHPDLLAPADLDAAIDSLIEDGYSVTWSNVSSARKEIRLTRYKHTSGQHIMVEVQMCWEVPKCIEQAANFYRRYFVPYYRGGQASASVEQQQVREAVCHAIASMWFDTGSLGRSLDELWLNEEFSQYMAEQVAAAGNTSPESVVAVVGYHRGLNALASIPMPGPANAQTPGEGDES